MDAPQETHLVWSEEKFSVARVALTVPDDAHLRGTLFVDAYRQNWHGSEPPRTLIYPCPQPILRLKMSRSLQGFVPGR